jgi:hypothetical protein
MNVSGEEVDRSLQPLTQHTPTTDADDAVIVVARIVYCKQVLCARC